MTLTIGDGFKFGCGLILSFLAFYFAAVIFFTGFLLVAMVFNLPVPSIFTQSLKLFFSS